MSDAGELGYDGGKEATMASYADQLTDEKFRETVEKLLKQFEWCITNRLRPAFEKYLTMRKSGDDEWKKWIPNCFVEFDGTRESLKNLFEEM